MPYPIGSAVFGAGVHVPCLVMDFCALVLFPGWDGVPASTEGLRCDVGLLNASATRFDTSGHSALSFLQVLWKHVLFTSRLTRHKKPANFQHNAQSQLFYCLI